MVAAATILESPGGLRKRPVRGLFQRDLPMVHNLEARQANLEAAYTCGLLNAWKEESLEAIGTISLLARIEAMPQKDALGLLCQTVQTWGSSNYVARKASYIKEFFDLDERDMETLDQIDVMLGHRESPMIQYSALENVMGRVSLFSVARRYTNILADRVNNDFRRWISLDNLIATPFCHEDCAGFLLRAGETSFMDAVASLFTLLNLRERFPVIARVVERHLAPETLRGFQVVQAELEVAPLPSLHTAPREVSQLAPNKGDDSDDRSLSLYRRSAVFLEYPPLCRYRNDIDRVIGLRLIAPLIPEIITWHSESFYRLDVMRQANEQFDIALHNKEGVRIDTFYRTYLFLRFIQDADNLSLLRSEDIQFLFDKTTRLEVLLLERELKTMHLNASEEARALISVLALSLYRSKSSDPDIDFDFRSKLEDFILEKFGGKILAFIDHLAPKSPEVANYIATSLDEVTLQKMYSIISSPSAAESVRQEILTSIGGHLNKIEYIIEAESIETRSKVAKLKRYFDTSRMFVDSVVMKKWLGSNPSAYTQQYKELLPKIIARLSTPSFIKSDGKETTVQLLEIAYTDEYLVEHIAIEAFREFCTNNEFGIESYLGRRIRHNTLHGVMTKSIDAVTQRQEYFPIISVTLFGNALHAWESGYKAYIERMRRDFLQFRSKTNPNALFDAEIDLSDPATKTNLQMLVQTLRLTGAELLDDLIISFCWRQIAPQLEAASRQIRVKMSLDVTQNLDQALQRFNGPEEQRLKSELSDAIASVFAQVASWFQVPQTGFVSASISELCNIVNMEHGRWASATVVTGDHLGTKYYGISVHRLYDCLAVLLQNAFKHGEPGSNVTVQMSSAPIEATNFHVLEVSVQSTLPDQGAANCIARVEAAVNSSETGHDMVTEGYSGIKKVKFITRLNEGSSTVSYNVLTNIMSIRFRLKVEVANEENGYDESPPR